MNPVDRVMIGGAGLGGGTVIWGLTSGQIQSLLHIVLSVLALIAMVGYVIYQWRRLHQTNKLGKAELETEAAEKDAARSTAQEQIKAVRATAAAEIAAAQAKTRAAEAEAKAAQAKADWWKNNSISPKEEGESDD